MIIFYKSIIIIYAFRMEKVLISACLAGERVRYDGRRKPLADAFLLGLSQKNQLIKVCPEVSGGLKIPRSEAQIVKGNGLDVLNGMANVVDIQGNDVTQAFIRGAEYALSLVKKFEIRIAILKEKSPSCGVHRIYDGCFASNLIPGFGVTAAILRQNGIRVFSEKELDQVKALL